MTEIRMEAGGSLYQKKRRTKAMKKIAIFINLLILTATLAGGCTQAVRDKALDLAAQDTQNMQTFIQIARERLKMWPTVSGLIKGWGRKGLKSSLWTPTRPLPSWTPSPRTWTPSPWPGWDFFPEAPVRRDMNPVPEWFEPYSARLNSHPNDKSAYLV